MGPRLLASASTSAVFIASSFLQSAPASPSSFFGSRSVAMTLALSARNASAMARPMPWPAAVTTQTLPFSRLATRFLHSQSLADFFKPPALTAVAVEILEAQPALEGSTAARPFTVEHRIPRGVAVAALSDHVLARNALEGEAEALGRAARGGVERIALPFIAAIAERLEYVASEKKLSFGRQRRPLQGRRIDDVSDLAHPHGRTDFHQRRDTDGTIRCVDDRIGERIFEDRPTREPIGKSRFARERAIGGHIGPDGIVAFDRVPKRLAGTRRVELFHAPEPALEHNRPGPRCGCRIHQRPNRLFGCGLRVRGGSHPCLRL